MEPDSLYSALFQAPPDGGRLWDGQYKIPWHEPGFSQRMLAEHLSQDHDLASRNSRTISEQVAWIQAHACERRPCRVLDLGCGPGLYLKALGELGHDCHGMDISPASIAHAKSILGDAAGAVQGDIRTTDYGSGFDLAVMIYGEFNVFSPEECRNILRKISQALAPGGRLLIEAQKFEAVKELGQAPPSWYKAESGLFSPDPHVCLMENHWYEPERTTLQRFVVIEARDGGVHTYRSTTKAWQEEEFRELLSEAGFSRIEFPSDWPSPNQALGMITALRL